LCLWGTRTPEREDSVEDTLISLAKALIGALALIMLFEVGTLL